MQNIPSYTLAALLNFLVDKGVEREFVLNKLALSEQDISSTDKQFSAYDYERLIALGQQALGEPNIGFLHGKVSDVGQWGLLGFIVLASENLWQALSYQRRYQCLLGALGTAYHELEDDIVTMRWLSSPDASANSIEQVITAWVAFAFTNTISNQKPESVHFVHSPLGDVEQYRAFFGCTVLFNSSFNGVVVNRASLESPLINHNDEVLQLLCCHAENQLAEKKAGASLSVIRQYITEILPEKVPELSDVAQHLGMSTRQLQRHFQKAETNLTSLLDDVRRSLAIAYLSQTDHKIAYIASVLGYSEQSAFQRAFKRWTGSTPQSFRKNPTVITLNKS